MRNHFRRCGVLQHRLIFVQTPNWIEGKSDMRASIYAHSPTAQPVPDGTEILNQRAALRLPIVTRKPFTNKSRGHRQVN